MYLSPAEIEKSRCPSLTLRDTDLIGVEWDQGICISLFLFYCQGSVHAPERNREREGEGESTS